MTTLSIIRGFYNTHRSKYQGLSRRAISLGKTSDAKALFRTLCAHLLGSGVNWEKAVDTVNYLDSVGVLWTANQAQMGKILRQCSYGGKYYGPKKASDLIYQNRVKLYDSGSITVAIKLLDSLSERDPVLARNVLAGENTVTEVRIAGTDINLKNLYIKGIGMKWASHFLRELGFSRDQLAILDTHILDHLVDLRVIERKPGNLSAKMYLEVEKRMKDWAHKKIPEIPLDHLDLVLFDLASHARRSS